MDDLRERVLISVVRYVSYGVFIIPLFITRTTFFPYIFGKMLVFQALVEIGGLAWLLLAMMSPRYRPSWRNPIVSSVTAFIGVLVISTFVSTSPQASLWSSQERMTGLVALLHFWLWFLTLHACFRSSREWDQFIRFSIVISLVVGLYGLGQKFHLPFVMPNATGERLASTLGNPIYLGIYSMIHVFLSGILALKATSRKGIFFYSALVVFNVAILLLSYSRGVFYVFLLSCVILAIYAVMLRVKKFSWAAVAGSLGIIILLIFGLLWIRSPAASAYLSKTPEAFQRVITRNVVDNDRIALWSVGIRGFLERPLFGWGLENFNLVYYKLTHPTERGAHLQQAWFDRSHNQVIDILSLSGVIGFTAYAAVWVLLMGCLMRHIRKALSVREKLCSAALLVLFGAYFTQNLTVFDSPAPLLLFYFLIAYASALVQQSSIKNDGVRGDLSSTHPLRSRPTRALIMIGSVSLAASLFTVVVWMPLEKSRLGIRALAAAGQNRFTESASLFQSALAGKTYTNQEIRRHLAQSALEGVSRLGGMTQPLSNLFDLATTELEKSIREQPLEIRNHLILAQLYRVKGILAAGQFERGVAVLEMARTVAPFRLDLYYELLEIYKSSGDGSKAEEIQKAIQRLSVSN
ncbi:MAG: O-antigen ligase family protein [Patescibacteria group bacterium]